jgi:hypothetical protein
VNSVAFGFSLICGVPRRHGGTEDNWHGLHVYEILAGGESDDERWAFPVGSQVRCREHVFSDGKVGLVACEFNLSESMSPG